MRRTKPPVGWEHVKNCFPVPNELLEFDLPGGAIAVYLYLLRHADRRTGQCHPSAATMALQNGVDVKTVSSMLGHYDAGFTLSVYAHATDRMQEEAAEKMGSFMAQAM